MGSVCVSMSTMESVDLVSAYQVMLREILEHGTVHQAVTSRFSAASRFGQRPETTREILGYSLSIDNPRACLIDTEGGELCTDLKYAFGLLAWSVTGQDDLPGLCRYNPAAPLVSSDGLRVDGGCGSRLFGLENGVRQWDRARAMLRHDPNTGRCVIPIVRPSDNEPERLGYPCALALQFFIRSGKLITLASFRSQNALTFFPYDAFLFLNLHVLFANSVGVDPGPYHQRTGTVHIYESDLEVAEWVSRHSLDSVSVPAFTLPAEDVIAGLKQIHTGAQPVSPVGSDCQYLRLARLSVAGDDREGSITPSIDRLIDHSVRRSESPLSVSRLLRGS